MGLFKIWKDHVTQYSNRYREVQNADGTITHEAVEGEVVQEGTPQNAQNFNDLEERVLSAGLIANLAMLKLGAAESRIKGLQGEIVEATLTNTKSYPFNNSKKTLALTTPRGNLDYTVNVEAEAKDAVRMAWEKIVVDYRVRQKSGSKKRYAYEFMSEGLNMLKSGKPQIYVYEEFGMKCGIKEYMKFSSLIVQNIKKGTKELALLLTLEAKDAFEERKNMAKKYGEEAGTKLLLPMIIMLIVVMAIIMVPALMSFSGY